MGILNRLFLSAALVLNFQQGVFSADRVVCRVDGRERFAKDLTGVDYDTAQTLMKNCPFPATLMNQKGTGRFEPERYGFSPLEGQEPRWDDVYRIAMSGVIERLLGSLAAEEAAGVHRELLQELRQHPLRLQYLKERSSARQKRIDLNLKSILNKPRQEILEGFRLSLPGWKMDEQKLDDMFKSHTEALLAHKYVVQNCFPTRTGDRFAPWLDFEYDQAVFGFLLERYTEQHKEELWDEVQGRQSNRVALFLSKARDGDKASFESLPPLFLSRTGDIAQGGVQAANALLIKLGSPSRLEALESTPLGLSAALQMDPQFQSANAIINIDQIKVPPVRSVFAVGGDSAFRGWAWTDLVERDAVKIDTAYNSDVMELARKKFVKKCVERAKKRLEVVIPFFLVLPHRDYARLATNGGVTREEEWENLPDGFAPVREALGGLKLE